jgi:hypothetical protein
MSQVLGAFGLLDFSMLRPVRLAGVLKVRDRLFLYFLFFFGLR